MFDEPGEYDGVFTVRRVLLLLGCWMVLWIVCFSLCIGNAGIDVAENIAWGQNFDWGYDKNPYFGAWLSYAVYRLFHGSLGEYVFYFMSQLSAMLGLFAVYLLAGDIFKSRFAAFLVVPLAFLIP
ncbi:MAG: glycosyltransferase family 39 protein [Lentisphaeria bacterium]|nr:glycosyltransferase family 39 protein [Lentisphaeria bacterium]